MAKSSSLRRLQETHAYRSAEKNGEWLTMSETAAKLGVTNHAVRRLLKGGILATEQVVPGAPYQIGTTDLQRATASSPHSTGTLFRVVLIPNTRCQCFQALENWGHNERFIRPDRPVALQRLQLHHKRPSQLVEGV